MERKALENLSAARLLINGDPCTNSAVSRAYYAAYHGCWTAMVEAGHPVPESSRGRYFGHKTLPEDAEDAGVLNADERDDLEYLEGQRVIADYAPEDVGLATAHDCVHRAARLVGGLVGCGESHE